MSSDQEKHEQAPPAPMPVFVNNVSLVVNPTTQECTMVFLQDAPDLQDHTQLTREVKGRVVMSIVVLQSMQRLIAQQLSQVEVVPATHTDKGSQH